jgi:hypothetical protein
MQRAAHEERANVARRFVPTRRHTMQVDFDAFMAALAREHQAGRKRALEHARSTRSHTRG